jgi:hypothetical protein
MRSSDLLSIFGVRKNCYSSGRNLLLYLFIIMVIHLTVEIIEDYLDFCICQIMDINWEYNGTVHQLFIDFEKACVSREVFYNILIEFAIPMRLVSLIEMCLNEICSKVGIRRYLLLFRMV